MAEQSLVTIVVPIYGVEKYLDRSIKSFVGQTYKNLEIILVDDCSPDRCPEICDEWAKQDARIVVIHKEKNEGLGMARNTGLEAAKGKYICFFDGDDFVLCETIMRAVSAIETENAEMAIFGYSDVTIDEKVVMSFIPSAETVTYRGPIVQEYFLPNLISADPKGDGKRLFYMSACMLLYTVDKIRTNGWKFVSEREIIAEDIYSLLDLFGSVEAVTVIPEALYCYRINTSSLSRGYKAGRYAKVRHFYLEALNLCCEKGYNAEVCHRISSQYIGLTLAALKQEARARIPLATRMRSIKDTLEDQTLQKVLKQIEADRGSWGRKLIFFFMQRCWLLPCYLLFRLKK